MPTSSSDVQRVVLLPPGPGNPRNSEGAFVELRDGRLMFVYSHYYSGRGGDNDPAYLAARFSSDRGETWTSADDVILRNDAGMNLMSVSLLRLPSGIGLFYLRKDSESDCRPVMRLSQDEGASWGRVSDIIPETRDYFVLNNDRVIRLDSGRLAAPVARHTPTEAGSRPGAATCYLSDDDGSSWYPSRTLLRLAGDPKSGLQEPGIVELKDGRLMMFCRTIRGSQYRSFSSDQGLTWSDPQSSGIRSPLSPAGIKRIPRTGDLLLVWNNNYEAEGTMAGRRTPLTVAISRDEGQTWEKVKNLEDDPDGWYCYTAICFVDDAVLLGHCAGNRPQGTGLAVTQMTRFSLSWLYA